MESTTKKFTKAFDPTNETHVLWLKKVGEAIKNAQPGQQKLDLEHLVNQNPFHEKLDNFMDWAYAHFSIAMKYTDAVLSGCAFIPNHPPKVLDTQGSN
ncbi:hypothetical protein [Dishui Lake phycodnavirus 4]|nr:hypothetical protein [Dishui Lake phycodnavirus 4]